MRAGVYHGPRDIALATVPEPRCEEPDDAVVRVGLAGICGSDLHLYRGRTGHPPGFVIGHEAVGLVESVGPRVATLRPGDRVAILLSAVCGRCASCRANRPRQCSQLRGFGFGELPGMLAERVRVPFADSTCRVVGDSIPDEAAVFLSDALATAYYCVDRGDVAVGAVVAVVGCGPIGLLTVMLARVFGARTVYAFDEVPLRLEVAVRLGAVAPRADGLSGGALAEGGADVVCETAGSPSALARAFALVRPGGTISSVGVYPEPSIPFPIARAFTNGLTFRTGVCPVHSYIDRTLALLAAGTIDPAALVTHMFGLDDLPSALETASGVEDALKVVVAPSQDAGS